MDKTKMEGLIPVMLTAFRGDLSIDWEGIDALVDFYTAGGAAGLFSCCLSSEMYELSDNERLRLTKRVAKRSESIGFHGPILATGTFGGEIHAQADFARRMYDSGADIVVILINQIVSEEETGDELRHRLAAFTAMTADIPLGLYECPQPYHRLVDLETLSECTKNNRYRYLKETSAEASLIRKKNAIARSSRLSIFDAYLLGIDDFYQAGGRGMSPIAANYLPRIFSEYHKSFIDDGERAAELSSQFVALNALIDAYPQSAKWFLGRQGIRIEPYCRAKSIKKPDTAAMEHLEKGMLKIKSRLALPTL